MEKKMKETKMNGRRKDKRVTEKQKARAGLRQQSGTTHGSHTPAACSGFEAQLPNTYQLALCPELALD